MQSLRNNFVLEKDLHLCWKSGYDTIIWIVKYIIQFWYLIKHEDSVCIRKLSIIIQYHIAILPTNPIRLASLWQDHQSFRHCVVFKSRYRNILKCNCKSNDLGCILTVIKNVSDGSLSRHQIIWSLLIWNDIQHMLLRYMDIQRKNFVAIVCQIVGTSLSHLTIIRPGYMPWMSNYIPWFYIDMIIYLCQKLDVNLANIWRMVF